MLQLNDVKLPLTQNEKRAGRVFIYEETVNTASQLSNFFVNNGFFFRLALVNRDFEKKKKKRKKKKQVTMTKKKKKKKNNNNKNNKKRILCHVCTKCVPTEPSSLSAEEKQFSSVQDGIYALGKAHMRSIPSLRSFPSVAFQTVPMFV